MRVLGLAAAFQIFDGIQTVRLVPCAVWARRGFPCSPIWLATGCWVCRWGLHLLSFSLGRLRTLDRPDAGADPDCLDAAPALIGTPRVWPFGDKLYRPDGKRCSSYPDRNRFASSDFEPYFGKTASNYRGLDLIQKPSDVTIITSEQEIDRHLPLSEGNSATWRQATLPWVINRASAAYASV